MKLSIIDFFKKISIIFLFVIIPLFFLSGCRGYVEQDGKIYHYGTYSVKYGPKLILIPEADAETFESITDNIGLDKNYVFRDRSIIPGADPATFVHVKGYFWKDSRAVYNLQIRPHNTEIKGADPATFKVIDGYWSKDKSNVYYFIEQLNGADCESFTGINENFGKDKNYYFWHEFRLSELDYNNVTVINEYYIKDKKCVYFENEFVQGCDPATFEVRGAGFFGHDKTNSYSWGENQGPISDRYRQTYIDK